MLLLLSKPWILVIVMMLLYGASYVLCLMCLRHSFSYRKSIVLSQFCSIFIFTIFFLFHQLPNSYNNILMHGSGFDCDNKYQHFSNGKGFDLNQEYPGLKSLFGENIKKLEEERANLILYHYKISIDFLRLEIQYLADLNLLSLGFVGFVFVLFVKHSLQQNEFRPLFVDRNIPDVFVGLSLVSALGFNLIAFTDIHKTLNFMSTQTFDANVICYTNFQHTLSKIFYGILVSFALPLACIAGFSPLQKVLAKD